MTIEGKPLPKGTYGLHMIPGENEWTVIFSRNSTSWGSFTYDQAEDAIRVTVKPQTAEFHEALTYDFDDVTPDSSVVTLRWEKVAVPFKVGREHARNRGARSAYKEAPRLGPVFQCGGLDDAAKLPAPGKG